MIPPSPPGIPLLTAAPPLPPTAVIVTLVTPAGTVAVYEPGVVDENRVSGLADAVPVTIVARDTAVSPPTSTTVDIVVRKIRVIPAPMDQYSPLMDAKSRIR